MQDSVGKTVGVAAGLCIVCSILVSLAAVQLKPIQDANKKLDIQKNLLLASGLLKSRKASKEDIQAGFSKIEQMVIELETGLKAEEVSPSEYNLSKELKDPSKFINIPRNIDFAGIKKREKFGKVYLYKEDGVTKQIILPVRGKGLWSTLWGFLALQPDTKTVIGLGFYQHGETPGLGGEVDNIKWKAQFPGKKVFTDSFEPVFSVVKGSVNPKDPMKEFKVDGLSGATLTSNGVQGLMRYWVGPHAYGPFLAKFREGGM